MTKIAIVGGGLAGISAARHAISHGFEIELFESSDHFGGRLASAVIDSCVIDRGFQVVNVNYPELKKLLPVKRVKSKPLFVGLSFIDESGMRRDISPLNIVSILSPASGSLIEKLRFLKYLASKSDASQTIQSQSFRFEVLYERVLQPFLRGVFLTNPDKIRGDVAKRILRYFLLGRPHLIDGGVSNLIPALLAGIPELRLHSSSKVMSVVHDPVSHLFTLHIQGSGQATTFENFDFVVIATNGKAGEINGTSGGNPREWLASTAVYHKVKKLPKSNHKLFLGASFVNSLIVSDANETYANATYSLIATTFLGELTDSMWELNRNEYEQDIADLYNCSPKDLQLISIAAVYNSLPLFSPSDSAMQQTSIIDPDNDRIFYAGDAFDEPSQNGALRSGRTAIEKILQEFLD
ncbi:MAG: FAD-dependent oxidoreductase [Actinobacteria bacterium]|nr:FAD-dependent oxidoreductase [Actinomycetota bacterium]